jgi:GT2 family glycosyltransferase
LRRFLLSLLRKDPAIAAPGDVADVRAAYRLFLGRTPESEAVVWGKARLSRQALINEIVDSAEFASIFGNPDNAAAPPWFNSAEAPAPDALHWAADFFDLTPHETMAIVTAKHWRVALGTLFKSAGFQRLAAGAAPQLSFGVLAASLTGERPFDLLFNRRPEGLPIDGVMPIEGTTRTTEHLAEWIALARATGFFDADFYRASHPKLGGNDERLLKHYLLVGSCFFNSPGPDFNEAEYVYRHLDALAADLPGLIHLAGRKASSGEPADESGLLQQPGPDGAVDLERIRAVDFFSRFKFAFEGDDAPELAAEAAAELSARPPAWVTEARPRVSIVIPVYGQAGYALGCLDSLARNASRFSAEVIVFDDASPPETQVGVLAEVPWVRYVRAESNGGFLRACNAAVELARGEIVVLLNSDARVCEGWLDELIGAFDLFPNAGLVGSKLFNADGSLQEAGGIVWRDGSAWNYGRDDDPGRPEYGFARRVDYCSGAAIAIPKSLWQALDGFDPLYTPAYFEDADLAFRVRAAGREVWFQPLARALHYEGRTHGKDDKTGVKAYQVVNQRKFEARWGAALVEHGVRAENLLGEANRTVPNRLLILDALTPMPDRDAGSVLTLAMTSLFQQMGWAVSFAPAHNFAYEPKYTANLNRVGVETLYKPSVVDIDSLIAARPDAYDVILVFRHNVLSGIFDRLRAAYPLARILFHNVDLHYLRLLREAELKNNRQIANQAELARDSELELVARADCTIVTSAHEAGVLRAELPDAPIVVYPFTSEIRRAIAPPRARLDVIFVGGFRHPPNVDAVWHFVGDVWPLLVDRLPPSARLILVGPDAPFAIRALADERIEVAGHVPDLTPMLERARVMIAPLRFGAGVKGKVISGLANGLPVVASPLAIEATGLEDRKHVLVAETPEQQAAAILELYADDQLWRQLQEGGYAFVEDNYSIEASRAKCEAALALADRTWTARRTAQRKRRLSVLLGARRTGPMR